MSYGFHGEPTLSNETQHPTSFGASQTFTQLENNLNLLNDTIQIDKGDVGTYRVSWNDATGPQTKLLVNANELLDFLTDNDYLPEPTT